MKKKWRWTAFFVLLCLIMAGRASQSYAMAGGSGDKIAKVASVGSRSGSNAENNGSGERSNAENDGSGESSNAENDRSGESDGIEHGGSGTAQVKHILVGTDGSTRPYTYYDENNQLTGYDIAVVKAIDELLPQYEIDFEVTEFQSIFAGIDSGRYQVGANNISKNPEREEKYLFGRQYYLYNHAVIGVKPGRTDITKLSDLAGKRTPVNPVGTFLQSFLEKYNEDHPDGKIDFFYSEQDYLKTYQEIMDGTVDFMLNEEIVLNAFIDEYNIDMDVIALSDEETNQVMNPEGYFIFPNTEEGQQIRDAFDKALLELIDNGTLSEISKEFLGRDYVVNITPISEETIQKDEGLGNLFDVKLVFTQIPKILAYLPTTLLMTIIAAICSFVLGFLIAMIKHKKIPVLSQISTFYVSFMRGTPMLVQLYLAFYGVPLILKYINYYWGTSFNTNGIPSVIFAIIAFTLNEAAYSSESIRAGLEAVDKGEQEAALSMGMTPMQTFWRITLPEALVIALPALGNSLVGLIKGTSLAFSCAVIDITASAKIMAAGNYRFFENYLSVALIYWALTIIISWALRRLEKKLKADEQEMIYHDYQSRQFTEKL